MIDLILVGILFVLIVYYAMLEIQYIYYRAKMRQIIAGLKPTDDMSLKSIWLRESRRKDELMAFKNGSRIDDY